MELRCALCEFAIPNNPKANMLNRSIDGEEYVFCSIGCMEAFKRELEAKRSGVLACLRKSRSE